MSLQEALGQSDQAIINHAGGTAFVHHADGGYAGKILFNSKSQEDGVLIDVGTLDEVIALLRSNGVPLETGWVAG